MEISSLLRCDPGKNTRAVSKFNIQQVAFGTRGSKTGPRGNGVCRLPLPRCHTVALQQSRHDWQVVKCNVSALSAGKIYKVYGIMWVTGD